MYAGLTGVWSRWSRLNGTEAGLVASPSAGPDDRKGWGRCRRPSRSSNRTRPVVQRASSPTRTADVGRQRPRAEQAVTVALRCVLPARRHGRSVSDQCGVAIAQCPPTPCPCVCVLDATMPPPRYVRVDRLGFSRWNETLWVWAVRSGGGRPSAIWPGFPFNRPARPKAFLHVLAEFQLLQFRLQLEQNS